MSRCGLICFEHDRSTTREVEPPCLELDVDIRVPWAWVEATIGEVHIGEPAKNRAEGAVLAFEGTIAKIEVLAKIYQPTCPACREPLHYVAWSVEDLDGDEDDAE